MTQNHLSNALRRIDNRPYPAYKDLRGRYDFGSFMLGIDRVQGDPFAAPSRLSLSIDHQHSGLPESLYSNRSRRVGAETCLAINFARACRSAQSKSGSGKSGLIAIDTPGQEILARTCVEIEETRTIVRFVVGLPANGRRINGSAAQTLLLERIPKLVEEALMYSNLDADEIRAFSETSEDADFLRNRLNEKKLVAFVADGAILPRASGIDQRPLNNAVPFQSPDPLRAEFALPNAGTVVGMGIPEGVTLIVGGGFHGKSTLLNAIERGVYNHRPGDGRDLVVTRRDATKVRAEDGRSVAKVNLSPFINNLPGGKDTVAFTTENASGSTSQAANIIEALETGCKALLLDEDISATNFLIRDARMQRLIADEKEPITPFVQRVRGLYAQHGISTIMVLGGSSDYFEPADRVIAMEDYLPRDLTEAAKALCERKDSVGSNERIELAAFPSDSARRADPASISAYKRKPGRSDRRPPRKSVKAVDGPKLLFGNEEIDLSQVSQLVASGQVRALGAALAHAQEAGYLEQFPLPQALQRTIEEVENNGLSLLSGHDLVEIRLQELAASLNRLRSLRLR